MRIPIIWTILAAIIGVVGVIVLGTLLIKPDLPLVTAAGFDREMISPNADGDNDIATFSYELTRNARVSIVLEDANGQVYSFRDAQERIAQDYNVQFSGVVDGYTFPDEQVGGTVVQRLIPDGDYTWRLIAEASDGEVQEETGTLAVRDADVPLPDIVTFTISPEVFTPNQDGRDDRVEINVYVAKQDADVRTVLIGENGQEIPISARKEGNINEDAQRYIFDYEGGIDLNADPPPDGTYQVVVTAQDDEGQIVRRTSELTLLNGGKPFAEIAAQPIGVDVVFESRPYDERFFSDASAIGDLVEAPGDGDNLAVQAVTMNVGEMLVFKLTVENYSDVRIRTTWPPPGTVYEQDQLAAAMGRNESPGAWRVGIECEMSATTYPYRWAIGSDDVLESEIGDNGEEFKYLPPNSRSVVWGAIHFTDIPEGFNPQTCYAGLIHEDVAVSERNTRVGPTEIRLTDPQMGQN